MPILEFSGLRCPKPAFNSFSIRMPALDDCARGFRDRWARYELQAQTSTGR
jgi:hypothetical protein